MVMMMIAICYLFSIVIPWKVSIRLSFRSWNGDDAFEYLEIRVRNLVYVNIGSRLFYCTDACVISFDVFHPHFAHAAHIISSPFHFGSLFFHLEKKDPKTEKQNTRLHHSIK